MFREMSRDDIASFSLVVIPLYMLIHLVFLSYFQHLWALDYVHLENETLNNLFHSWATPFSYMMIFCGVLFWVKPKLTLPLFLILFWLVQAPTMNALNWHDQHVAFLTFLCLSIIFWKSSSQKPLPLRRLVLIFLAMFYYGAGLGKLYTGGLEWMNGDTAQYRFLQYYLLYDAKLGLMIAENFLLCQIVSVLTVVFELIFPVCLFVRRLEKPFLWLSLAFLTTIYATMKINFFLFLVPIYIVFLPWHWLTPRFKQLLPLFLKKNLFQ